MERARVGTLRRMQDLVAIAIALATAKPVTATHPTHVAHKIATAPKVSSDAPADRYFGQLHMSAIGIRMRIDVLGRRYSARSESDADILHDARDVKSALDAWLDRYPKDTWAAPTSFHLAELYADVQTPEARSMARDEFAYVGSHYASTRYGHLSRRRLAQGFPPLHDESPVVATPGPSSMPSGAPTTPASGASPQASPAATPSPAASASPSPRAT